MTDSQSHSPVEPLLEYFNMSIPLNEKERDLIKTKFHSRLYRKRQFVLHEGDICTQLNFVVRGCLRTYKIDEKGGFKKIIGEDQSAGELLSSLLPKDAKLAKALGTLGVTSLSSAAFQKPPKVLFYATDDISIKSDIEQLIRDNGFDPIQVGGLEQSIRIEVFGDLHEFGALGKTVTRAEAQEQLNSNYFLKANFTN